MSNTIDLDKVNAGLEKIEANPDVVDGLTKEIDLLLNEINIELNYNEQKMLLMKLIENSGNPRNKGNFLCLIACV